MGTCWHCKQDPGPVNENRCTQCKWLQPVPPGTSHFALLALPESFDVSADALDAAFRKRSLQVHPDRFARAEPRERRIAAERTAALNMAYAALKDPESRAVYMLQRVGLSLNHKPDPSLLMDLMEAREQAEEDPAFRQSLLERTRQRRTHLLEKLHQQFRAVENEHGLGDSSKLSAVIPTVLELRYQGRLLDDLSGTRDSMVASSHV